MLGLGRRMIPRYVVLAAAVVPLVGSSLLDGHHHVGHDSRCHAARDCWRAPTVPLLSGARAIGAGVLGVLRASVVFG